MLLFLFVIDVEKKYTLMGKCQECRLLRLLWEGESITNDFFLVLVCFVLFDKKKIISRCCLFVMGLLHMTT
eukprot:UN10758